MAEISDRESIPEASVAPPGRRRISMVWIVPIFAVVVAVGIAIQRILSEGPTITIIFKRAEGIEAGKTFVKYKDVKIGQVTAVELASDYSRVEVKAQIVKSAEGLIVEDAKFWVVEPRVTLRGITGLGTLLSGNYIGFETGKSKKKQREFTGLDAPPAISLEQEGRKFALRAHDLGSLGVGSPIYYRRLPVGEVVSYRLTEDGSGVDFEIFVNAPYDKYVTVGTRFWNASGIDVSVGAGGVEVHMESLATLIGGGLAFETPAFAVENERATADTAFTLYRDRSTAMKAPSPTGVHYVLYFKDSLRGLDVGAPVTLLGFPVGEVTDVGLHIDSATNSILGRVEIVSYPERLVSRLNVKEATRGKAIVTSAQRQHSFIKRQVEVRGLRAQLKSASLLTGKLYIAMEYFPNASRVKVDWSRVPTELPVVPGTVEDIESKITSIVAKIDRLPIDAIGKDVRKALATLDQALQDTARAVNHIDGDVTPQLKAVLEELRAPIATANRVLKNADATLLGKDAPAQQELREALQEITRAARSARVLIDYLERHPEALIRGKARQ